MPRIVHLMISRKWATAKVSQIKIVSMVPCADQARVQLATPEEFDDDRTKSAGDRSSRGTWGDKHLKTRQKNEADCKQRLVDAKDHPK